MKNVFSLSIFVLLYFFSFSQSLPNTEWAYVNSQSDSIKVNFETDTMRLSDIPSGTPGIVAWYKESNDTIWTIDIHGSGNVNPSFLCDIGDTGIYTFNISNNTLKFTKVEDVCTARSDDMSKDWISTSSGPTGINEWTKKVDFSVFPNPNQGVFTIDATASGTYEVVNMQGSAIINSNLVQGKNSVHMEYNPGMYLIIVNVEGNLFTQKVLIE